jgi:hypothetical protein
MAEMSIDQGLVEQCFMHFYGLDVSNAAIHCADVRFSPITFRLQEALDGGDAITRGIDGKAPLRVGTAWHDVQQHNGTYQEDAGR